MTTLRIRPYDPSLAAQFRDINTEWIETMFVLEDSDKAVLGDPDSHIIAPGGDILFVEREGVGIVGACALRRAAPGVYELTKMGVTLQARGHNAGAFLLNAMLERARAMPVDLLYLLTSGKCAAAVHLYEKHGFVHDAAIMTRFGRDYDRCNVAMRYTGPVGDRQQMGQTPGLNS